MAKVFIVQEPLKRDTMSNTLVPFMDLSPASAYGEINILLPHGRIALAPAPMIQALQRGLQDFSDDDYLVAIGDPTAIAGAVMVASKVNHGRVNLLKWNRETRSYIKTTLEV